MLFPDDNVAGSGNQGSQDDSGNDLASRIMESAAFDVSDTDANPDRNKQAQGTGDVKSAPSETDQLREQVATLTKKFDDREAEFRLERQQYQGMVNRLSEKKEQPIVVQPAPVPEKKQSILDLPDEQLVERFKTNAPSTIRAMISEAVADATAKVRDEVTGQLRTTTTLTQAQQARREAMQRGTERYRTEILNTLDESQREEFDLEAGNEIRAMFPESQYGANWPAHLLPESCYDAGSRVMMRWMRSGKAKFAGASNGSSGGNGGLREIIRSQPVNGSSDRAIGSGGSGGSRGPQVPTTIDQLPNMSDTDKAAARRVAKNMGLTEKVWVANHLAAMRDDPNYGRG